MIASEKDVRAALYQNPSFDLIYSEAFSNALDAEATKIKIDIEILGFKKINTLKITIEDNGVGFTEQNYERFLHLFRSKDKNHKGIGRTIYLEYFSEVLIESVFCNNRKRSFVYKDGFKDPSESIALETEQNNYAKLVFTKFSNSQLKSYDNVVPESIKKTLLEQFLPRLYAIKQKGLNVELEISLKTTEPNIERKFYSHSVSLTLDDLPKLKEKKGFCNVDFFNNEYTFLYLVENDVYEDNIIAICADGRAIPLKILRENSIPQNVHVIFLLESPYLDSQVSASREFLELKSEEKAVIEHLFLEEISAVLNEEIPEINKRNEETKQRLSERFPHLTGLLPNSSVGLIDEDSALAYAQDIFFKQQKKILNSSQLSDELYELSLNHAARVLTEYILYRNITINKLKEIEDGNLEDSIHNLIVPMKKEFSSEHFFEDIYNNNAWILDDKYMTYRYVLSDLNIKKLVEKISSEKELQFNDLYPDIAFVFSDDIEKTSLPVDVVVVELKKKDLPYLDNVRVLEQIKQRAKRLVSFYPNKIQRMWFFGVVDFDDELMTDMEDEHWIPIVSAGTVFYKEIEFYPRDINKKRISEIPVPVSVTLMSHDALWKDAQNRNNTFLNILKSSIKRFVEAKGSGLKLS